MKFFTWFLIVVLIGAGVWVYVMGHRRPATAVPAQDDAAQLEAAQGKAKQDIQAQVAAFGDVLKNISLLSPTAAADMQQQYAPYVTQSLLAAWVAHPDTALGRTTSSPWPDHITISDISVADAGTYTVRATLVYMTSEEVTKGGDAGSSTIQLVLKQESGAWKIDSVSVLSQNRPNAPLGEQDRPQLE